MMNFFSMTNLNLDDLAVAEAEALSLHDVRRARGGIEFSGDFTDGMRYCMHSRLSNRLLLKLAESEEISCVEDLRRMIRSVELEKVIKPSSPFMVTCVSVSSFVDSTMFASQVVKDSVCDGQRELYGERSDVDREDPEFVVHLYLNGQTAMLYLDFSGPSLSKRRYRVMNTPVYLQENTSAAVLMRSGFMKNASAPTGIVDPFAGSGTILIEAALMATDTAPGLIAPDRFLFRNHPDFDPDAWQSIVAAAKERSDAGKEALRASFGENAPFVGFDIDPDMLEAAGLNAEASGMNEFIEFRNFDTRGVSSGDLPDFPFVVITDPPYGMRMSRNGIESLYCRFGERLTEEFQGKDVSILAGDQSLLSYVNLKPFRTNVMMNGQIKCQLAHYHVLSAEERAAAAARKREAEEALLAAPLSEGAQMFYNRIMKNRRALADFLSENSITCYRIYDADMKEYSAAIDIYDGKFAVLAEYEKGEGISEEDALRRLEDMRVVVAKAWSIPFDDIFVKKRRRMKDEFQYGRTGAYGDSSVIHERGFRFIADFTSHIDVGIYLDHRGIRSYIRERSRNRRFLNLFCYTGTATVYAAAGGALSTVSVDASQTYLDMAAKNMSMNGFTSMGNFYVRRDVGSYLESLRPDDEFDLIFMDAPTFSNGKSRRDFDVQADHAYFIRMCMSRLSADGELVFSTHFRDFELDEAVWSAYGVEDVSERTLDEDFRDRNIRKAYVITKKNVRSRKLGDIVDEIRSL